MIITLIKLLLQLQFLVDHDGDEQNAHQNGITITTSAMMIPIIVSYNTHLVIAK
jgi:hypothetical protein